MDGIACSNSQIFNLSTELRVVKNTSFVTIVGCIENFEYSLYTNVESMGDSKKLSPANINLILLASPFLTYVKYFSNFYQYKLLHDILIGTLFQVKESLLLYLT